jgi:hypothetical protein
MRRRRKADTGDDGEIRARCAVKKLIASLKSVVDWVGTVWTVVALLGLTTAITGIGGAIWAIIIGVPKPIAIMAGYCTIVGGVYLTVFPLAYRAFSRIVAFPVSSDATVPQKPSAATWQHVPQFTLYQAACLLAEVTPVLGRSLEGDAEAWFVTLCAEIRSKELPYIRSIHDKNYTFKDGYHPHRDTEISRAEFQRFAERHGIRPRFLFPD